MLDMKQLDFIPCKSANGIEHFFHLYNIFNQYGSFFALFDRDKSGIACRGKMINDGISEKVLLLIPQSNYKKDTAIEDLVDKEIWDKCLNYLDQKGLIKIISSKGQIVGYDFDSGHREKAKTEFSKKLITYAKKDISRFDKYREMLHDLNKQVKG